MCADIYTDRQKDRFHGQPKKTILNELQHPRKSVDLKSTLYFYLNFLEENMGTHVDTCIHAPKNVL